jgi:hypothetical protein
MRAVSEDPVELVPFVCAAVDSDRIAVYGFRTREGIRALEIRKGPVKAEHRDRALHTDLIPRDIDHKSRMVEGAMRLQMPVVCWCWVLEHLSPKVAWRKKIGAGGCYRDKGPAMSD